MTAERKLRVLHAIVNDHVASNEPIASKSLVERHRFGVSAATIRNDMAQLEDEGLIEAPHTSSGRVPTDKGYRVYVDALAQTRPLSSAQRSAIERFLGESEDLDDVMQRTVRLLAQLTNQVAVAQYPSQSNVRVRHIELVPIAPERVLSVVITGAGVVEQQVVTLPSAAVAEAWVNGLRERIATATVGSDLHTARQQLQRLCDDVREWAAPEEAPIIEQVLLAVSSQLAAGRPQRFTVAGTANLSRAEGVNFGQVLEALEEQVTLLRLFAGLDARDPRHPTASIGRENEPYGLSDTSVISSRYDDDDSHIGVLGPTRMDYAANMSAVQAVARYLGNLLGDEPDDPPFRSA